MHHQHWPRQRYQHGYAGLEVMAVAVSTRREYKYLVPLAQLEDLRKDLAPYVELDPFSHGEIKNEYTVRSIYLDTFKRECYNEKVIGEQVRKKYRIRGYGHVDKDSLIFLEVKRKYFDTCSKNRAPLLSRNLANFFSTRDLNRYILSLSGNGVEKDDANRFLYYYYRKNLHPVILIVYEREAFLGKFDPTLRLTFDKNIRSRLCTSLDMLRGNDCVKAMNSTFVFEVKFHRGVPGWLQSVLRRHDLVRTSVSKYTICLDSLKRTPTAYRDMDIW
jgi:hypothetical protein